MVMIYTPKVWQYAFAREHNGYKCDLLYRILHAH